MDHSTFDTQFTNGELQMLKILLPCFPQRVRGVLAVMIKLMELRLTIYQVQRDPRGCLTLQEDPLSQGDTLFAQLSPFCSPEQKEKLREFQQIKEQINQMKEMMEMAEMMQEMFPQGAGMENMDLSQLAGMFGGGFPGEGPPGEGFPGMHFQKTDPPKEEAQDGA